QMRRVAEQDHAPVMPFAGDTMVDLEQIGADQLSVFRTADESHGLLAKLVVGELALAFENRVKKAPALRLAHKDHPFLGIAEIAEIREVARVLDVEVDLQIDEREALWQRAAFDRDAETLPHGAASPVTAQKEACVEGFIAVRRVEFERDVIRMLCESCQAVPVMNCPEFRTGERVTQSRLHVGLRQVDDKGKARFISQKVQLDG